MKKLSIFCSTLLFIGSTLSQGPCIDKKIIGPASPKPRDAIVTVTCSSFTAQWTAQAGQSFVFTAVKRKAVNDEIIDTIVDNTLANSITIPVSPDMVIRWQVEAVTTTDGKSFYSYPLRGGKDYIIPACNKSVVAVNERPQALTVTADTKSKLKIYPNPFQSSLNVEFGGIGGSNKTIVLFDMNGKMVSNQSTGRDHAQVDVKELVRGAYLIRISDTGGKVLYTGKVVKE